jgi:hypothetical protein
MYSPRDGWLNGVAFLRPAVLLLMFLLLLVLVYLLLPQEAGSDYRRWSSMNWYELGVLVVNRSINEDVAALPDDLDSRHIDPQDFPFSPRRDR